MTDKIAILNFIATKPLFSRFLKELGLIEAYTFNVAKHDNPHYKAAPDENLISGTFLWGSGNSKYGIGEWNNVNRLWLYEVLDKIKEHKKINWEKISKHQLK